MLQNSWYILLSLLVKGREKSGFFSLKFANVLGKNVEEFSTPYTTFLDNIEWIFGITMEYGNENHALFEFALG